MRNPYESKERPSVNRWMVGTIVLAVTMLAVIISIFSGRDEIRDVGGPAASGFAAIVGMLLIGAIGLCLYFLPTAIAVMRGHHQAAPIILLNVFLGWTFLGWVGALIWSVAAIPENQLRR